MSDLPAVEHSTGSSDSGYFEFVSPDASISIGALAQALAKAEKPNSLCGLPKEVLVEIFLKCEDPQFLVQTCRAIQNLSRDERLRTAWFIARFGPCFAIAQAIARKQIFTDTLFKSLLRHGALFPRCLSQEVVSRWGRPGHRVGWAFGMQLKAYMALIQEAFDQYGGVELHELDHRTFENWLFGYRSQNPRELVDRYNFIPQPFCHTGAWIQQAITKDVSYASKWHALGLRFTHKERTEILKSILCGSTAGTQEQSIKSRREAIESLIADRSQAFEFDYRWAESIIYDLTRVDLSLTEVSHPGSTTTRKAQSNFEVLKALRRDGIIDMDLYAIVKKTVVQLFREAQAPGIHVRLLDYLAKSFPSLLDDLGPAWLLHLLFQHQYRRAGWPTNWQTTVAGGLSLDAFLEIAWEKYRSGLTSEDVLTFLLHPMIVDDMHILDLIKEHSEIKDINLIPDWHVFFDKLIRNLLLRSSKGKLLQAVCGWATSRLGITLAVRVRELVLRHKLPTNDPLAAVGPATVKLDERDRHLGGSYGKVRHWSERNCPLILTPLGVDVVGDAASTGDQHGFTADYFFQPLSTFDQDFFLDPSLHVEVPEDWPLEKALIASSNDAGDTSDSTTKPLTLVNGTFHQDQGYEALRKAFCAFILSVPSIGHVLIQDVCKGSINVAQVIFDHSLVQWMSTAAMRRLYSYRPTDSVLPALSTACLAAGARIQCYHFELLSNGRSPIPKCFKDALLCPNGTEWFSWGSQDTYQIESGLTPSEKEKAASTWNALNIPQEVSGKAPRLFLFFMRCPSPSVPQMQDLEAAIHKLPEPFAHYSGYHNLWQPQYWLSADTTADSGAAAKVAVDERDVRSKNTDRQKSGPSKLMQTCLAARPNLPTRRRSSQAENTDAFKTDVAASTARDQDADAPGDDTSVAQSTNLTSALVRRLANDNQTPITKLASRTFTVNARPHNEALQSDVETPQGVTLDSAPESSPLSELDADSMLALDDDITEKAQVESSCLKGIIEEAADAPEEATGEELRPVSRRTRRSLASCCDKQRALLKWTEHPEEYETLEEGDGHEVILSIKGQPFKFTENERRRYLRNTLPLIDFLKQICNLEAKKRALLKLCGSRGVVVDVSFFEADLRAFVKSLEGLTTTLEAAGEKSHSRPEDCRAQQVLQELLGLHEDITSREGGSTLLLEIKESYDRDEKKRSRKACLYRRPASHRRSSFRLAKCRIARPGTAAIEGLLESEAEDEDFVLDEAQLMDASVSGGETEEEGVDDTSIDDNAEDEGSGGAVTAGKKKGSGKKGSKGQRYKSRKRKDKDFGASKQDSSKKHRVKRSSTKT